MDLQVKYNLKSPGVKRLMREAAELSQPTEEYSAKPLDDNLFEWHFTVRGPLGTEFEGGVYHGRILLPTQYPMHPPNIILLTPNGRFETNKKICLSISGHHPESWQPSWSIRTALLALIAFMPTPPGGTIGSLDYSPEERQILAKKSQSWQCPACGKISEHLAEQGHKLGSKPLTEEETSLIQQIALKAEEDALKQKPPEQIGDDVTLSTLQLNSNVDQQSGEQIQPTGEIGTTASPTMQTRMLPNDKVWNYAVWVILIAIGLLVFRRIFLL